MEFDSDAVSLPRRVTCAGEVATPCCARASVTWQGLRVSLGPCVHLQCGLHLLFGGWGMPRVPSHEFRQAYLPLVTSKMVE